MPTNPVYDEVLSHEDWALPDRLFFDSFASRRLNIAAARDFALRYG